MRRRPRDPGPEGDLGPDRLERRLAVERGPHRLSRPGLGITTASSTAEKADEEDGRYQGTEPHGGLRVEEGRVGARCTLPDARK